MNKNNGLSHAALNCMDNLSYFLYLTLVRSSNFRWQPKSDDEGAGRLVSVNKWEFASQIGTVRFKSYNNTNFAKMIDRNLHMFRSRATLTVMVCPAYWWLSQEGLS